MRVYQEIERVRDEKQGADLREQVMWRIDVLGGDADLTDSANRFAFADILDGFVPENHTLVLNPSASCRASQEYGGLIEFTGSLVTGGNATAELGRRIFLERGYADHRRIRVVPRYRGNRI